VFPGKLVDGEIGEAYGKPLLEDPAGDNLNQVPHLDLLSLHVMDDSDSLYLGLTISGDVYADPWGKFLIYFDTTENEQGADIDVDKRPITVADPHKPEYRLDIRAIDRKGTVSGSFEFSAWDGTEWQTLTMTGGAAIRADSPSVIEIQIPKLLVGKPAFVNLGVVTTGRGRVHTAGDIMGTEFSPSDWREPVILDIFGRFETTGSQ
jgi:hypothetical protein